MKEARWNTADMSTGDDYCVQDWVHDTKESHMNDEARVLSALGEMFAPKLDGILQWFILQPSKHS